MLRPACSIALLALCSSVWPANALTPTQTRKTLALAGERTADLKARLLRTAKGTQNGVAADITTCSAAVARGGATAPRRRRRRRASVYARRGVLGRLGTRTGSA